MGRRGAVDCKSSRVGKGGRVGIVEKNIACFATGTYREYVIRCGGCWGLGEGDKGDEEEERGGGGGRGGGFGEGGVEVLFNFGVFSCRREGGNEGGGGTGRSGRGREKRRRGRGRGGRRRRGRGRGRGK